MAQEKSNTINLLDPINSPSDTWTAAYNWISRVGRYLLVGVEILVLGVFFARFFLDRKNNDLTEDINDKVGILANSSLRSDEVKFRNLHTLFADVDELSKKQPQYSEEIASILSGVPSTLNLEKFSFNLERVNLSLTTSDTDAVKDYEFSLKKDPKYSDVNLTISRSGTGSSEIDVTVTFVLTSLLEE